MAKEHFRYNWTWGFWARNGGSTGFIFKDGRWQACWIEPNATCDGQPMLMGFAF